MLSIMLNVPERIATDKSVSKRGIILANSVGIIDSGYRGPLMAAFYNTKKEPVEIKEVKEIKTEEPEEEKVVEKPEPAAEHHDAWQL